MKGLRAAFAGALLLAACSRGAPVPYDFTETMPPVTTTYFRPGTFHPDGQLDEFKRRWFSWYLSALREPTLLEPGEEDHGVYRFLWLSSFERPVAVRVILSAQPTVVVREADGASGYHPGSLSLGRSRPLTPAEAQQFLQALERADFWREPTREPDRMAIDGARWILEGRRAHRYHVTDRHSPDAGPLRDLGLLFLELGDIQSEPLD